MAHGYMIDDNLMAHLRISGSIPTAWTGDFHESSYLGTEISLIP